MMRGVRRCSSPEIKWASLISMQKCNRESFSYSSPSAFVRFRTEISSSWWVGLLNATFFFIFNDIVAGFVTRSGRIKHSSSFIYTLIILSPDPIISWDVWEFIWDIIYAEEIESDLSNIKRSMFEKHGIYQNLPLSMPCRYTQLTKNNKQTNRNTLLIFFTMLYLKFLIEKFVPP